MSESPRIRFMVGGFQKCGTTALASYLRRHPDLGLPEAKEAHVFDAPDYPVAGGVSAVDALFASRFAEAEWRDDARLLGDATPITVFLERAVARVARYNPRMRWILLLRDPVDRAISHWHMERRRGVERLPMALAFLLEPWRLRMARGDLAWPSPLRWASYVERGRYRRQLAVLQRHFPKDQLLLLDASDLDHRPTEVLARVARHLRVSDFPPLADAGRREFEGGYRPPSRFSPGRLIANARLADEQVWREWVERVDSDTPTRF